MIWWQVLGCRQNLAKGACPALRAGVNVGDGSGFLGRIGGARTYA